MRDIFYNKNCQKWAEGLLIILLVDYLLLFGAEAILPGFVMAVFNLNYLLVVILLVAAFLAGEKTKEENTPMAKNIYYLAGVGSMFLLVVGIFDLYKAESWQIFIYLVLSVICFALIHRNIRQQE